MNNPYNLIDRHYLRYRYQLEKYIHKMELREELEDAPDVARLTLLQERNRAQMEALGSELALAFASQQMEPARKLTAQLQYLNRISEEIDAQTPVR